MAMNELFRSAGEERPSTPNDAQLRQFDIDNLMDNSGMSVAERNQFQQCLQAYGWR